MAKIHLIGAALAAAALVAGCSEKESAAEPAPGQEEAKAHAPDEVVAAVAGESMTRAELERRIDEQVAAAAAQIPPERLATVRMNVAAGTVRQFLVEKTLAARARALGIEATEDDIKEFTKNALQPGQSLEDLLANHPQGVEKAREELKAMIVQEKLVTAEVLSKDTTDYSAKAQEIVERVKADNAKIEKESSDESALAKITEIKKKLDETPDEEKAARFAELARENSECGSAAKGGDLGTFKKSSVVPEFWEGAIAQPLGTISGPVKSQFGYHLILPTAKTEDTCTASHILVMTKKPLRVPTLDEVAKSLKAQASGPAISDYIVGLIHKSGVKLADDFKQLLPPAPASEPAPAPAAEPTPAPEQAPEQAPAPAPAQEEPAPAPVETPDGK